MPVLAGAVRHRRTRVLGLNPLRHRDVKDVDLKYAHADAEFHTIPWNSGEAIVEDVQVRFGKRVREIRERKDISQEKLGELAGLHRTYVSSLERGKRNVSLVNIEKLAKALDVTMGELITC
jgi:ribosome-binding protein aMBF1 (putative translation factor)